MPGNQPDTSRPPRWLFGQSLKGVHPPVAVIEFHQLRVLTGIFGIMFPIAVVLGNCVWGDHMLHASLSEYYYAGHSRDVFVGMLCAMGTFLLCYRGYPGTSIFTDEQWRGIIAGLSAYGVALFPCRDYRDIHYPCAGVLFLILGSFAFFQFTKTRSGWRRNLYRTCGIVIFLCVALLALYRLPGHFIFDRYPYLFTALESFAVWAFGIAWLVKGW